MRVTTGPRARASVDDLASIREKIRRQVAHDFLDGRQADLSSDTPLVSAGLVDSAGVVHLVDWLEGSFEVRIDDDEVTPENFDSIGALADLVLRLRVG